MHTWFESIRRLALLWFAASCPWTLVPPCAQAVEIVAEQPQPGCLESLLGDLADGTLDQYSMAEAFLIAGGIEDARQLRDADTQLEQRLAALHETLADVESKDGWDEFGEAALRVRAERLFVALHRELLTGRYIADCTSLARVLEAGDYNCVTATMLYHQLCARRQIPCRIVCTPAHVFCRIPTVSDADWGSDGRASDGGASGDLGVEVQTTCAAWFRIADDPALLAIAKQQNPCLRHHPDAQRELGELQLLGKVFYNRGLAALEAERFEDAAELFRVALQLDRDDTSARTNLLATYNEWALDLVDRRQFAAAADRLEQGRSMCPDYRPYLVNDLYVHQRWAQWLCEQEQYDRAIAILEAGRRRRPDAALFQKGPAAIARMRDAR